jgi:hypothetical protein
VASNNNLLRVSIDKLIQGNLLGMAQGIGLPGMFPKKGTAERQPAYR